MRQSLSRTALAVAVAAAWQSHPSFAQQAVAARDDPHDVSRTPTIVVTGNPLGSDLLQMVTPANVLEGEKLKQRVQTTLGETLSQQTGVSSTYYGPNASRPVIRGLDGDHIRILQNGLGTIDASGASVDHAVSLDPLLVDRIEVVRGPAALLYGGSAVGGVVNVIDGRIPQLVPADGLSGAVEARYGSAAREKSVGATLDAGGGNFVLHADGSRRETSDLSIPGFARSERLRRSDPLPAGESEPSGRLPNSASDSRGGAVGASYVWDKGYFGAGYSLFDTDYGVVAEQGVTIDLEQKRFDLGGELREVGGPIETVKLRFGQSDYEHRELEGSEVGTTFRNRGYEARVDATHGKPGAWRGAFGVQTVDFEFSALGEEAFLPVTHTRSWAAFLFEEVPVGDIKLQFGARVDRDRVSADADDRFGPAERRSFTPVSGSLGLVWPLASTLSLVVSGSWTERSPNYQELFADGPHLATDAFERGDRTLGVEKSGGVDVALRLRGEGYSGSIGAFYNRFRNFITLTPTGEIDSELNLPIFDYRGVAAEFKGLEAEGSFTVFERRGERLGVELRTDYTRATNRDTGEPLPRIAPWRVGGALEWKSGAFGTRLEVDRVQKQDRVAANETPTDGYTMVNLSIDYHLGFGDQTVDLFARGTNLLDEEARNHVSFLKDIAPLAGRGVTLGATLRF